MSIYYGILNTKTRDLSGVETRLKAVETKSETNKTDVATNLTSILLNGVRVADNTTNITTNKTGVATNKTGVATNKTGVATNKTDIATNKTTLSQYNGVILNNVAKITKLESRFPITYKFYLPNLSTSLQSPKLLEAGFPPDIVNLKGKIHIFLDHIRIDDDGGVPSGSAYVVSIRLTIYYSTGTNSQHYLVNKSLDSYAVGGSHQGNKKIFLLNESVDIKSIDSSTGSRITEYGIIEFKHSDSSKNGNEMYLVMTVA